jgi:hypothetical protein
MPVVWSFALDLCSQIWRFLGFIPLLLLLERSEWKTTGRTTVSINKAASCALVLKILVLLLYTLAGRGGGGSWSSFAFCLLSLWPAVVVRRDDGRLQVKKYQWQVSSVSVGARSPAISSSSGCDGGEQRSEMARSEAPGVICGTSQSEEHQQRHYPAASSCQRGCFAPRSWMLRWIFFLQAMVPSRRIFTNLYTAFIIEFAPSGFVPGGVLDGRWSEVLLRRWRRARLRLQNLFRVLFRTSEDFAVISLSFWVLFVICPTAE